ncbi:hypothetical protein F2Q70_00002042 [Brassica cretica]|uniref:Uncharacterized protein n=1 Tax=Brassica cretica TaxID=69181 RepID=A0A8S9IKU2_BRACR|nr:hypothetical protein F2Q70_00002042 [Brassica cretica]
MEEDDVGPSDKPDKGGKALCYKGAVESQNLETNSGGDIRRHNQQLSGKQDVKGKGIAYEGGRQAGGSKLGPGRRHRDQGRSMTRCVRQAGYLPPQELRDGYAFKSGESGETSESNARKALLFENEIVEESLRVTLGEDHVAIIHLQGDIQEIPALTKVVSIEGSKEMEEEIARKRSSVENDGKQTLDIGIKENEVIGEMVAGLDEEDGNLEYEMMEDGEEEAGREGASDPKEEKEHQIPKKKNGKITAAAMGGNAKKRLVQIFVSPRKKAMAKQVSKAGDKGPGPTKKALVKPKPDHD